jgi:acetylornithine deacetylase
MTFSIHPERLVDLLQRLVQIDSVNPSLVPGGKGEEEIARFIARLLSEAGLEVTLREAAPGRPNVIARLRGSGGGKTLILNAHTDVVSVEGMLDPFSGKVADGRLYGRGALDTKAGLAAGIEVMLSLKEGGIPLAGDLVLAAACDEEYASIGSEALVKELSGDACIILEPSGLGVCVAHGGYAWAEIETFGVAAHGAMHEQGVDAIARMGPILTAFDELGKKILREKSFYSPLAGEMMRPSWHTSIIAGGRELSSYPDRCLLKLERRLMPTDSEAVVQAELDGLMAPILAANPDFKAAWRVNFIREPWQAVDGPFLAALESACQHEMGSAPPRMTVMAWMDSSIMEKAGIPSLIFGPSGEGIHGLEEYADIESVTACARVLGNLAVNFCG